MVRWPLEADFCLVTRGHCANPLGHETNKRVAIGSMKWNDTMGSRRQSAVANGGYNGVTLLLISCIVATLPSIGIAERLQFATASRSRSLRNGRRQKIQREAIRLEYYNLFAASSKSLSGLLPKESSKASRTPKGKRTKSPFNSQPTQSKAPLGKGGKGSSPIPSPPKHSQSPSLAPPSPRTAIPSAPSINPTPPSPNSVLPPAATTGPVQSSAPISRTPNPSAPSPIVLPSAGTFAPASNMIPTPIVSKEPSSGPPSKSKEPTSKDVPAVTKMPTVSPLPSHAPKTKLPKATKLPTASPHPSLQPKTVPPKLTMTPSSKTKAPDKTKAPSKYLPYKTKAPSNKSAKASASPSTHAPSILFAPTGPPSIIPSNGTQVDLAPYSIGYSIAFTWIPSIVEVEDVVVLTRGYLDSTFRSAYEGELIRMDTTTTGDKLFLNAPYQINYTSSAVFRAGSLTPSTAELDSMLESAFSGSGAQSYIALLQELGPDNIFSTTSDIVFMSYPSQFNATVAPLVEAQENNAYASRNGLSASLVATVVCAASVALVLSLGLAYRKQKQRHVAFVVSAASNEPAPNEIKVFVTEIEASESRSLARDDADTASVFVCAPGFDSTMVVSPSKPTSIDGHSDRFHDPLEPTCALSDDSDLHSPFLPNSSQPLASSNAHHLEGFECHEQEDSIKRRRRQEGSNIANPGAGSGHLIRSASEDEDVPLRVIDLIRFFTPQRQLEPPGDSGGR